MAYVSGKGHMHWGPGTSMIQFKRPAFGMGACCDSCAHGGTCSGKGMGLFDSGMDFTTWGLPEWSIVGLGAYMVFSTLFTTKRAAQGVARIPGGVRKGIKRGRKRLGAKIAGE